LSTDRLTHLVQITGITGREVVQADHLLVEFQQRLQQVGTDKTGNPGNQPAAGALRQ
jgi:hypothetical protein